MDIRIEDSAGFCFGVVSAIDMVENELENSDRLYCLGDIVHNDEEVKRLAKLGLRIISLKDMKEIRDTKVMIRAHGEPPSTYEMARENNIEIVDATCPIVLKLQRDVEKAYIKMKEEGGQVLIYGKKGHAEVVGLVGQTNNTAIVISNLEDLNKVDYKKPISVFSQTTMSKEDYKNISDEIKQRAKEANPETQPEINIKNSICQRVASRTDKIINFANEVDIIVFVSGKNSSNGLYLYNYCKGIKPETYFISSPEELEESWFKGVNKVGITGATSTPMWLMEEVRDRIYKY